MQASTALSRPQRSSTACAASPSGQHAFLAGQPVISLANAPQRRRLQRQQATQCFGGAFAAGVSYGASPNNLSQIASAVGLALGALWVGREMLLDQERAAKEGSKNPECPTCEGTGTVECMCSRWSDGDSGCATCRGTGRMTCHSCGGGGTGVPAAARILAKGD